MTGHGTLQCLQANYPKTNHGQALKQPITGLGNDAIPECNADNTPYIRVCRSSEKGDGRRVETSLVPYPKLSVNN